MSQLDLALAADVSARHVSFLETGRAHPSREMALRLAATLDVPLRGQNEILRSAGFDAEFDEPESGALPELIQRTLEQMKAQQEPFPLLILSRTYDLLDLNRGALALIARLIPSVSLDPPPNLIEAIFDPALLRPHLVDFERTARFALGRLHREALGEASDGSLNALLDRLLARPDVPAEWREPDLAEPAQPAFVLRVTVDGEVWSFLTTVTAFSAPQNVSVQELRIEAYYPLDDLTRAGCQRAARS